MNLEESMLNAISKNSINEAKISNSDITQMSDKIWKILENIADKQGVKLTDVKIDLSVPTISSLWFKVFASTNYDDNNANVAKDKKGVRLFKQDEDFELYPNGTNDNTITTAYQKISKIIQKKLDDMSNTNEAKNDKLDLSSLKNIIKIVKEKLGVTESINESVTDPIKSAIESLIKDIQDKNEKVVDKRSLASDSDGEILGQFLLPILQSAAMGLKDSKSFRAKIKKGM